MVVCSSIITMVKSLKKYENVHKGMEIQNFILCKNDELDLGITLKGGQSFRWISSENDTQIRGVFCSTVWTLFQEDNKLFYTVHGSLLKNLNYDEILTNYFRLDLSLKENLKIWTSKDSHFKTFCKNTGAVRILNQDVIENLFSFICSSNNNIIRISGMVEKLCQRLGKKICNVDNKDYYDFPTLERLANPDVEAILRKEGFGYRAKYIVKSAEKLLNLGGREWLLSLTWKNQTVYEEAREKLMSLPGVGPKVADCICLMSLGHLEAIPVDTHIFQVACAYYIPNLSKQNNVTPKINQEVSSHLRELWGPLAGWAQAVVFCAKLNSNDNQSKKRSILSSNKSDKTKKRKKVNN